MQIFMRKRIYCVICILNVTLPGGMSLDALSQENPYFLVLTVRLVLFIISIKEYKHKKHDIKIILRVFRKIRENICPEGDRPGGTEGVA